MRGRPMGRFWGKMTLPGRPGKSILYLFFIETILNRTQNYQFFSGSCYDDHNKINTAGIPRVCQVARKGHSNQKPARGMFAHFGEGFF
jgi:hypothetical protein